MRLVPILFAISIAIFSAAPARAEAPVVAQARKALQDGAARLQRNDLRGAEGALEEARTLADEAGETTLAIEVRLHLGELFARSERMSRGVAALAEAIALADALESRGQAPPGPSVAVRGQLAEMLRAHGQTADSEAAAWDALGRAVSLERLDLAWPAVRLVVLAAVDGGASPAVLNDVLAELDLSLSGLDAYRLALPPPPETIPMSLEGLGKELLQAGEPELARETLMALAAIDASRNATFRLPSDLARVSTAATLAGESSLARWASDFALQLQGSFPSPDVLGAACAVALDEERWGVAESYCRRGSEVGTGFASAALTARLARALDGAGDLDGAQKARQQAQKEFVRAGAPADALVEQAERAWLLARMGRFESADRELVAAVDGGKGTGAEARVDELRLRVALEEVRAGRVDEERAQTVLADVGAWLFRAERADDLAALAAYHADRALAAGELDAAMKAADHAVIFEVQLGWADEGWRALEVRARVHDARGSRVEADADRAELLERVARRRLGWPRSREPFFGGSLYDAHLLWPKSAVGDIDLLLHRQQLHSGLARARGRAERDTLVRRRQDEVDAVRSALHGVSFRGSERPIAEVRAELARRLQEARAERDASLLQLAKIWPGAAWLWGATVDRPTTQDFEKYRPAEPVHVQVFCPERWTPPEYTGPPTPDVSKWAARLLAMGTGKEAEVLRPTLQELAALDLGGLYVEYPDCPSQTGLRELLLAAGAVAADPITPAGRPAKPRRQKAPVRARPSSHDPFVGCAAP